MWQSYGTCLWGALESGNLIPSFKIKPCLVYVVLVPIWDPPSHCGAAHVSPPEWDCRERPIGKKWDSRLSNFAATVIHQAVGRWQWKWLMETDRWVLTFHWFVLKKHRAWDLLSEHDHVHYDCHLRPFLYISMGSLPQKKMEEVGSIKTYTREKSFTNGLATVG